MLAVTLQSPWATSATGTPVLVSQRARSPMDAHVAQIEGADVGAYGAVSIMAMSSSRR
jgi:hypothetical protein